MCRMRPRRRRSSTSMRRVPCRQYRPARPNPTATLRRRCRSTPRATVFQPQPNRRRPPSTPLSRARRRGLPCRSTCRSIPPPPQWNRRLHRSTGPSQASRPGRRCQSTCPGNPLPLEPNRLRHPSRCRSSRLPNLPRPGSNLRRWSGPRSPRRPRPNPRRPSGVSSRHWRHRNRQRRNVNREASALPSSPATRAGPAPITPTDQI